jgi:hypothetical protein
LLAPRSQWRVLVSWTYRDPHADEPTMFAYGLYRVVAALGIAAMVVSGVLVDQVRRENAPEPPPPPTAIERMWGVAEPVVVDRVFEPLATAPAGLVDQPILGYQVVDGKHRQPPYLFSLPRFSLDAATTENGLLGEAPPTGLLALDTAQLVVEVAGDPTCFPQGVVVLESGSTVRVGVYYGRAPVAGGDVAEVPDCITGASAAAVTTLIPIRLETGLGERVVETVAGDPVRQVPLIE